MISKLPINDLLEFLSGPPDLFSLEDSLDSLKSLHCRLESEDLDPDRMRDLSTSRIFASNTLRREGDGRSTWDIANHKVAEAITNGIPLDFELAVTLNGLLVGEPSAVRTHEVYAGDFKFPLPDEIPGALDILANKILKHENVMVKAAWSYIWICNIHPFANGNGRTARLFADAILIAGGMPPVCFPNLVTSMVIRGNGGRDESLECSIKKFLKGIRNSYGILLDHR